jgi:hypothetical protein
MNYKESQYPLEGYASLLLLRESEEVNIDDNKVYTREKIIQEMINN